MKSKGLFTLLLSLILSTGWGQQLTQTFSWNGLTLNYPSNYTISDKEYDSEEDMYFFGCDCDDEDVLSMMQFTFNNVPELNNSTKEEKQQACEMSVEEILSVYGQLFDSFKSSPITQNTTLSYPNAMATFTVTLGKTGDKLKGKAVTIVKGSYLIVCTMEAEDSTHFKELEAIVKTISVN